MCVHTIVILFCIGGLDNLIAIDMQECSLSHVDHDNGPDTRNDGMYLSLYVCNNCNVVTSVHGPPLGTHVIEFNPIKGRD